jgi:hypothetical protein
MESTLQSHNSSLTQPKEPEDPSDYDLAKMCQILADNPEKAFQIRKQKILNLISSTNLQRNPHCFKFNDTHKLQDSSPISEILPLYSTKSAKQNSYRSSNLSRGASPQSSKLTSPTNTFSRNSSVQSGRTANRSNSPSVRPIDLQKVSAHNVTCLSKRSQVKILKRKEEAKTVQNKDITKLKESFYSRAVKWKENQIERAEKQKEAQEQSKLKECTFTPKIIKGQSKADISIISNSSLYDRSNVWKENIRQRNECLQEIQNERQLETCTFQPITNTPSESSKVDPLSIYNRNIEWKNQIQQKLKQSKETYRSTSVKKPMPLPQKCPLPLPLHETRNDSDLSLKIEKEFMDLRYLQLTDMLDSISKQIEACISKDC